MPGQYSIVGGDAHQDDQVYRPDQCQTMHPFEHEEAHTQQGRFRGSLDPIITGDEMITFKTIFLDPRWTLNQRRLSLVCILAVVLAASILMICMLVSLFQTLAAIKRHDERMHHGLVLIPQINEDSLLMGNSVEPYSHQYTLQMALAFNRTYNINQTTINCDDKDIGQEAKATCDVLKSIEVNIVILKAQTRESFQKQKNDLECPSSNKHYGFYYENDTVPDPCLIIMFKQPDGWRIDDVANVSVGCNMTKLNGHTIGWTVEPAGNIAFNTYLSLHGNELYGSTQWKQQPPPAVVFKLSPKSTVDASNKLGGTLNCWLNVGHTDGTITTPNNPELFAGNALLKLTVHFNS